MRFVKRRGHDEPFDNKKLYASIYAACMSVAMAEKEAELLAETVSKEVEKHIKDREEVSSFELHSYTAEALHKYNPDVAFLYDTHRDIA